MGLFATEEEKKAKAQEKQKQKIQNLIERYGLQNLPIDEAKLLPEIASCFRGSTLTDLGSLLSGDDDAKLWNIQAFNQAIFTQNWMIINQLTKLNKNIEKLIEEKK